MLCRFLDTLGCDETDPKRLDGCRRCGWNPEVSQRRAEKVRDEWVQKRSPGAVIETDTRAHEDGIMIPQAAADCKG